MREPVVVRPGTEPDVARLVPLHRAAFADAPNARLGDAYVRAFLRWFATEPDTILLCAVDGLGAPLGYVAGAPIGYNRRLQAATAAHAVHALLHRPDLLFRADVLEAIRGRLRRGAPTSPELEALAVPQVSLVSLAVAPAAQGRGVGKALIAAFEGEALARGFRTALLTVRPGNEAALGAYRAAGWVQVPQPGRNLRFARTLERPAAMTPAA